MKKINDLLENRGGSHILPFFWMHGEDHDVIWEELNRIEECGIREICLESRPHPEFCKAGWWRDVNFILEEAKKRNMRIWVLDDDSFPTGHANGAYHNKYPHLSKTYLAQRHMDIIGPVKDGAVLIRPFLGKDGKLMAVIACPKPDSQTLAISGEGMIDLTAQVHDDFVYFQLPEGRYRLFVLYTTQSEGGRADYINLIDTRSVRVLIDEVYESHYERYSEDFGKAFAGFFSDEPELGNTPGYDFHELLGKTDVKLPWSEELAEELYGSWKEELVYHLPALWYDMGEKTVRIRSRYMEAVTGLVKKCFSGQLGSWCEQHGIEYIGHIIEDDNAHTRLGCSIGHYFREMKGQHMSGIDVVHHQIIPGFDDKIHQWIAGDGDGEFFHYGLAKMGSSCAHIDPKKKGRALCEIFGNYGWAEGVSFMKWLTDHMLVRGINVFVPHAFSPKYPDPDCPPHFYARGNNPQFKFFARLMKYMNRISDLISDGVHISDAAVLYHGEAEWSGKETQLFQKPVRELMEAQLDCDIIPADVFTEDYTRAVDGTLRINKEKYGCLIIPYCEAIPKAAVNFITEASSKGLSIYVIDELPGQDTCGNVLTKEFQEAVSVIPLNRLVKVLLEKQKTQLRFDGIYKSLRFYCYEQEDGKLYLFFNESREQTVDTTVTITEGEYKALEEYDAMENRSADYIIDKNKFRLYLEPGQLKIMLPKPEAGAAGNMPKLINTEQIVCDWKVSLKEAGSNSDFEEKLVLKAEEELPNMNGPEYFSSFSGTYRYEGGFEQKELSSKKCLLYLPKFGDCAEITVNGAKAGILLASPGRLDITDFIRQDYNELVIEVTNTLVWKLRDSSSAYMQVEATGLTKLPVLEFYE